MTANATRPDNELKKLSITKLRLWPFPRRTSVPVTVSTHMCNLRAEGVATCPRQDKEVTGVTWRSVRRRALLPLRWSARSTSRSSRDWPPWMRKGRTTVDPARCFPKDALTYCRIERLLSLYNDLEYTLIGPLALGDCLLLSYVDVPCELSGEMFL